MGATLRPVVRQPVYLQVADRIRDAILDGTLTVGEPLPSERSLQSTLGVGRTTVREALRALEAQGLIGRGAGGWRSVAAPSLQAPFRDALVQLIELDRVRVEDLLDALTTGEQGLLRERYAPAAVVVAVEQLRQLLGEIDGDLRRQLRRCDQPDAHRSGTVIGSRRRSIEDRHDPVATPVRAGV